VVFLRRACLEFSGAVVFVAMLVGLAGLALMLCFDTYCNNDGWGGSTDYMQGFDHPTVANNDAISAIKVYAINPQTDSYTFFKKECDYYGYGWVAQPKDLNNGENIFMGDLERNHIGNDALSRVITGPLAAVTLYQDEYYQGAQLFFTGGDSGCLTSRGWNDRASSVHFYNLGNGKGFPKPVGSWVQRSSGGYNQQNVNWDLHYGYTTTDSTSTTATLGMEMTTSMEAGCEFAKASVSLTVSASISNTVSRDITQTTDVTCSGKCEPGTCTSGIMYLWNWHMAFYRPWDPNTVSTAVDTCNWICTCGANPPACPLTACLDDKCSTCLPYR